MQTIGNLLNKDRFQPADSTKILRSVNEGWEEAKGFVEYVGGGLTIPSVIKLFNRYGKHNVLSLSGWAHHVRCDHRGKIGLIIWELNKRFPKKKTT